MNHLFMCGAPGRTGISLDRQLEKEIKELERQVWAEFIAHKNADTKDIVKKYSKRKDGLKIFFDKKIKETDTINITVKIPFEGDQELLLINPGGSSGQYFPSAEITGNNIVFTISDNDQGVKSYKLGEQIIRDYMEKTNNFIDSYNEQLEDKLLTFLEREKKLYLKALGDSKIDEI